MRLLVLLLVGSLGAVLAAWGLARGGRAARLGAVAGTLALAAVTVGAFLQRGRPRVDDAGQLFGGLFDAHLVGTEYLRLVVGLWGLESLVLLLVAWLLGGLPRVAWLLPATLAAITAGTVAIASADLAVGAAAATATGLATLLVVLRAEGPAAVAAGARELRVTLLAGAVVIVAMGVVPLAARLAFIASGVGLDEVTEAASSVAGPALGAVTLAMGLAVAARWGMLPLHVRVSRLTDIVPTETLSLLLAWTAVPLTVVVFAIVDRIITPLALPLDGERAVLLVLALATLTGAALAAFLHDDLRHLVGYLVVADAGLLVLAIAALDPVSWGAGREWVVALAASKTALAAWAAVVEDRFETRSVPELRGWIRRSPLLAVALAVTAVATFGLPGWLVLDARQGLADGAWGSPWREVLLVAGFLTLPAYLRLAQVGVGRVTSRVDRAAPERIVRRRRPLEVLPVEQEGVAITAVNGSGTPRRGGALGRAREAASDARASLAGAAGSLSGAASGARSAASSRASTLAATRRAGATARAGAAAGDGEARVVEIAPLGTAEAAATPATAAGAATPDPAATASATAEQGGAGRRGVRRPEVGATRTGAGGGVAGRLASAGAGVVAVLRRDRTELLSGAVLALAILAALTSWGALDLAAAASEPAPVLQSGATD